MVIAAVILAVSSELRWSVAVRTAAIILDASVRFSFFYFQVRLYCFVPFHYLPFP